MSTFRTEHAILFGERQAPPVGSRPRKADFVAGRITAGEPFYVHWWPDPDAVAYHVFRSQSVSQIRERSMDRLWSGHFRDEVMHFIVGDGEVGGVVDDYRVRGAAMMFYWVLVQDRAGGLRVLRNFSVRTADEEVLEDSHFLLAPKGGGWQDAQDDDEPEEIEAIEDDQYADDRGCADDREYAQEQDYEDEGDYEDEQGYAAAPTEIPQPAPAPRPRAAPEPRYRQVEAPALRRVAWARYRTPAILRVVPDAGPVDHFSVYIGPTRARDEAADAMWDDDHFEDNPMARYDLPPKHHFITDRLHPPGTECYVAVMVVRPDGTVGGQAKVGLVEGNPPQMAVLK